jgi:hypothetical protein
MKALRKCIIWLWMVLKSEKGAAREHTDYFYVINISAPNKKGGVIFESECKKSKKTKEKRRQKTPAAALAGDYYIFAGV